MHHCKFIFLVVLALSSGILGEIVEFSSCDEITACKIHEVRIEPCKEAAKKKPCKIKVGKSASISYDFTPEFQGTNLYQSVAWESGTGDMEFDGLDTDGCHFTQCPVTKSQKQTFTFDLKVSKYYPKGSYPLKWKLWNEGNALCCFRTDIKLT